MSVKTLGPVGGVCRTPLPVKDGSVTIQNSSPFGAWLNLVFAILAGVGPQLRATATLNFPNTLAQASSDLTIAVPGARAGQPVSVSSESINPANSCFTAFVSADDVVTVRFNNYSTGAINPGSGDYSIIVQT